MIRQLAVISALAAALLWAPAVFAGKHAGDHGHGNHSDHHDGDKHGKNDHDHDGKHHDGERHAHGHHRHYWHGKWWDYGIGPCWRWTPAGWIWICGD